MPTDRYTEVVLTVIATALVGLLAQNAVRPVTAQGGIMRVAVCSEDGSRCAAVGRLRNEEFNRIAVGTREDSSR